ncbi:uncharacterized protein CXQ87_004227 [Candidozyma duobushaemuli]|uniref:Uncharacterized protein n=1 Tax=Candidozyma duobushaemuli TaxID=1231522 RepID=A0A2V1AF41_9ASCO|nr:uncharacterized protein CXQ87_004227 [[Candida] duobushaemulonis]PVH16352.1 hypothetical protein CXQ87_004227 [[Candida] duobushaemulonis]
MASAAVGSNHQSDDQKKESSPASFLPSLKSFDIDPKYKYQAPQEEHLKPKAAKSAPHTTAHSRSSSLSSENPLKSPLEPPHGDVLRALSLPSDKPWPYSEDTLNELIRLRIEQEKTKHTQIKHDLGQVVLELLREAQQHEISSDVIRRLFLNDNPHSYVHYLQTHLQGISQPPAISQPPGSQPPSSSQPVALGAKRKNSTDSVHTPGTENESKPASQAQSRASPKSESKSVPPQPQPTSQSPQVPVVPQHLYPVYYAYPEGQAAPQNTSKPAANPPTAQAPHHSKSTSQSEESENLGSPYSHKYPVNAWSGPQRPPPPQTQPPPYYYVNSSPQGVPGPLMPSQYFVPPPVGTVFPWGQAQAPAPEREDRPKRHKASKNGINFMITTPKNPPAKKYNKS